MHIVTTQQRANTLSRFAAADRWLARVYDPNRSTAHRIGIWQFLMKASDPKLRNIILQTREMDEQCITYWDRFGKN